MIARMSAMALSAALAASAAAEILYGVAAYAPFTTQSLYAIDPATGAATLIGNTGVDQINGIAYDAAADILWAFTTDAETYVINRTTGAAQLSGNDNRILSEGDIAFGPAGFYAVGGDTLGTVGIATGLFTPIGGLGAAANDVSGLTFARTGALLGYSKNGAAEDTLVSIDPATGVATTIGILGFSSDLQVGALTTNLSNGVIYLTDGVSLFTVNAGTGAAAYVGEHGVIGFSGLAYVPEPASLALLALGMLSVRRR